MMKTKRQLIISTRLGLALAVLAMLGTLPTALAAEAFPTEGKRDGMDCAGAADGSCSGGFTQASTDPTGVFNGGVAWGDYDDDGDLDILLAGGIGGTRVTEVWRNDGGGTFTQVSTALTGVNNGDVAWGDYDDDGDLDILLAGDTGSTRVTEVWENDGGTFSLASADPTGVDNSAVAWGDYDDDEDLDILLAGDTGSTRVTEVWENDGGTFTLASADPTGADNSDVAWGDYDDDGDLDILLAGYSISGYVTEVWSYEESNTFTQTIAAPTGVSNSSVAWGDYDDDGDLDILLAGNSSSGTVTEVWRNDGGGTFTQASTAPTGVHMSGVAWGDYDDDGDLDILLAGYTDSATRVTEVWRNEGSDTFSLASSDPTGVSHSSVAWGDYDDDGDLDILLAGHTGSIPVTEVWRNETCRCSGSTFTQASTDPTGVDNSSVAWGDYDNDGDLDILLAGYTGSAYLTQVWRNDGGDTFAQAGIALTGIRLGSVAWGDYDHDGDLDILLAGATGSTTRTTEVWRNNDNGTFTRVSTAPTGVSGGGAVWGDYDDDGDLDILLTGYTGSASVTEVWRNDDTDIFTQASTAPTGVSHSSVAWGDYDDDGDLDILLAGYTGSGYTTEVWRNGGSDNFAQVSSIAPTGVNYSSVAWGDYDDDGDLDILLAGRAGSVRVTEVWRNDGGDTFTQASTDLTGIGDGSVAWGDYDDDGDLDILLAGHTGSARVTEVWENDGGTFTLAIDQLTGVSNSDVAWGDYDDDGDLDILLAGGTGSARVTEVWRSECFMTFLPLVLRNH
jgi:hypothetical protein